MGSGFLWIVRGYGLWLGTTRDFGEARADDFARFASLFLESIAPSSVGLFCPAVDSTCGVEAERKYDEADPYAEDEQPESPSPTSISPWCAEQHEQRHDDDDSDKKRKPCGDPEHDITPERWAVGAQRV